MQRPSSKEFTTFKESIQNLNKNSGNIYPEKNPQIHSSNQSNYLNESKTNFESNSNNSTMNFDNSTRNIFTKPENLCFTQAIEEIKNKTMSFMQNEDDSQNLTDQEITIISGLKDKICSQEDMLKGLVSKLLDLRKESEVYSQRFDVLLQENTLLKDNFKDLDSEYQMSKQTVNDLRTNFMNALAC